MAATSGQILNFIHATDLSKLTAADYNVSTGKHYNDIIFVAAEKKIITHGTEYTCNDASNLNDTLAFFNGVTTVDSSVIITATKDGKVITFGNSDCIKAVLDEASKTIKFEHINDITAVTTFLGSATAAAPTTTGNDVSVISGVKFDKHGHITGVQTQKITLKDTDTHYTAKNIVGASNSAKANATTANTTTFLNLVENDTVNSAIQIKGSGATTVSATGGVITIDSTDTDTHYTAKNIVGASNSATANAATTNGSTYINLVENDVVNSSILIKGQTNVTVTSDATGTITIAGPNLTGYAPKASPALTGTPTAPTAATGTNTTQIATTAFVKSEISSVLAANDAMQFKGTIGTGGTITALPAAHAAGDTYKAIAGCPNINSKAVEEGDLVICIKDGTTAKDADWTVIQTNIDGAVTGPAASTDAHVAVFDGATGKIIKDSGFTIGVSVPANAKFTDTVYTHPTTAGNKHIPTGGAANQTLIYSADGTAAWSDNVASSTALGRIKIGYTQTEKKYPVELDATNKAYVEVPWVDTDTHYEAKIVAASSATNKANAANTSTTNAVFLNVIENDTVRSSNKIVGGGIVKVSSDANGVITITGTESNPTLADLSGISAINGSTGTASYITVNNATKSGTTATLKVDVKVVDTSSNLLNGSTGLATAKAVKECLTWIEYN